MSLLASVAPNHCASSAAPREGRRHHRRFLAASLKELQSQRVAVARDWQKSTRQSGASLQEASGNFANSHGFSHCSSELCGGRSLASSSGRQRDHEASREQRVFSFVRLSIASLRTVWRQS